MTAYVSTIDLFTHLLYTVVKELKLKIYASPAVVMNKSTRLQ